MSGSWLWLIVYQLAIFITPCQSRYIRLPSVNCSELAPIGTPVTQLLSLLPSSNWGFTFLTRTSVISYFLLDDLKGTLTVKRPLDREDLCRLALCSCSNDCLLKLEINALSDIYTHIIHVPILILDENDNFCYFPNDVYYLNISESVRSNSRIILPIAHDPDQPPNNVQSYAIVPNNYSEFRLESQLRPSLVIDQPLDRERQAKYAFQLCAYEGNEQHKRSCCTQVLLSVTDVNDNSPTFQSNQRSPVVLKVSESSPVGTELIQMRATDPDEGLNGHVRYSFSKWTRNDQSINRIFHLNADNGTITLVKQLDFEERNNYELQIQAKDSGANAVPAYATVIVEVTDENDWPPEMFAFSPADVQLVNNSIIYILENVSLDTPILYITVSDRDSGENARVSVELIPAFEQASVLRLDKVTDNTYALKTTSPLDREQQSVYAFSLLAADHGRPTQTSENHFELHLIDVNDCSPSFTDASNYTFDVNENNQVGLFLRTVDVLDGDEHDRITLRLQFDTEHDYSDWFKLNEHNQLVLVRTLDYEKQSVYRFAIEAEDKIGHRTTIPVVVRVTDLNDNPVTFPHNTTRFELEENQPNQTLIGQIQANDADPHSDIAYTIHPDDVPHVRNFIELKSDGQLFAKRSIDRETTDRFRFRVLANDSLYTDVTFVEINIVDQNDNRPTLPNASPLCYIYNASNSNETIEVQLEGHDPDAGDNGRIVYSLRRASSPHMKLLPTGRLIIEPIFQEYKFDVQLSDQGRPESLSSIYEHLFIYIVYDASECRNFSSMISAEQLQSRTLLHLLALILTSLACFILFILFICCCFYYRQQRRLVNALKDKPTTKLAPSFSSSLNEDAENDTLLLSSPSPQFTAMTTVSTSTTTTNDSTRLTTFTDRLSANKSSSLSSSSSSTYVKMSRSFEDEIL